MFTKQNRYYCFLPIILLGFSLLSCSSNSAEKQSDESSSILIFSKTEAFRHGSIETGVKAIQKLASEKGLNTSSTEDASYFNPDSLASYKAVIFLNTTGNILNDQQQQHFEEFIQQGGGFVGIHAATDTEYEWPWYGKLVGAYFMNHPKVQEATLKVMDKLHPATSFLSSEWVKTDEWYNFKNINKDTHVLLELDETSYEGGKNGDFHPISWYHVYDGGKAFYTGLGHTKKTFSNDTFLKHLWGGISYVLGEDSL